MDESYLQQKATLQLKVVDLFGEAHWDGVIVSAGDPRMLKCVFCGVAVGRLGVSELVNQIFREVGDDRIDDNIC